jgi:hypothetical protein
MSDSTDDPTLLASVYLDNEATRDERALVETSPETLGEVERLGRVRTVLAATIEPVSLAEREGHLAAALDVWERMTDVDGTVEVTPSAGIDAAAAAALTTPRSSSTAARGRRGSKRTGWTSSPWLLGAAAALVVLAGVGAVLSQGRSSSTDTAALPEAADVAADQGSTATEAAPGANELSAPTAGEAESSAGDASASEASVESASTDAGAQENREEPTVLSIPDAPAADSGELVQLETTDDLASFARLAVTAVGNASVSTQDIDFEPADGSCEDTLSIERIVETAFYQDTYVTVGIDLQERIAYAYADDCSIVAQSPLDP